MVIPMPRNDFSEDGKNLVGDQRFQMSRLRKVFILPNADSLPFQALEAGKHLTSPGKF